MDLGIFDGTQSAVNNNKKHAFYTALFVMMAGFSPWANASSENSLDNLLDLPLEELLNVSVSGVGSLTETKWRHLPASVTYISNKDIARSGARSLDDLLEIYVPGFQVWLKTNGNPMGLRGIISDRNTKMLLLVNGRLMNEHTSLGIISERYLSMLSDIKSIEVIRGPGSNIYGPGAITGVINITTFNGNNFTGNQVNVRAGSNEEFYSAQYQSGMQWDNGRSLFLYYGVDKYRGASQDDAKMQFSVNFTNEATGQSATAYENLPFPVGNYREAHREQLRHKLHIDYRQEDFTTWLRYTKGGVSRDLSLTSYSELNPAELTDESFGYQQATLTSDFKPALSNQVRLDSRLSYDILDIEYGNRNYREDELMARALLHWTPSLDHKLSGGMEYSKEYFGKKSLGYPGGDAFISNSLTDLNSGNWSTSMASLLVDYQWHLNADWTLFAGNRSDKHTYTKWMHSPRLAAVFTPTATDQYKVMLNRSVRRADDDNLREYYLITGMKDGRTETINALELNWERQWAGVHRSLASVFYNDYDLVGWDSNAQQINRIGNVKTLGLELEGHLTFQTHALSVLYSYVAEQDFTLAQPDVQQFISASVYGFGSDLANWANHSLKLVYRVSFNTRWDGFSSLRSYWGLEGSEAMADYNRVENNNDDSSLPRTDGQGHAYEERIFWDIGTTYNLDDLQLGLHAYNILGWIDADFNRRNTFSRSGQYRLEAPALAFSLGYDF